MYVLVFHYQPQEKGDKTEDRLLLRNPTHLGVILNAHEACCKGDQSTTSVLFTTLAYIRGTVSELQVSDSKSRYSNSDVNIKLS